MRFVGVLVLWVVSLGCGSQEPAGLPASSLPGLLGAARPLVVSLPVAGRRPSHKASVHVSVHAFEGALEASEPVSIGPGQVLEFVGLQFGPPRSDCTLRLETAGSGGRVLWNGSPRFAQQPGTTAPGLDRFARPVRVSLAGVEGRSVTFRWSFGGGCLAGAGGVTRVRVVEAAPAPLPPVLLVCSDQHRWDWALGPQGRERMPALASFAERSVTYPSAFSSASWTLPSIVSTLTGSPARLHRTGERIESGAVADFDRSRQLPPGQFSVAWGREYHVFTAYPRDLDSLQERLQGAGYTTAAVVTNAFYQTSGLLGDGFDVGVDLPGISGSEVNRLAISFLDAQGDAPLFLLVHYMDVHEYLAWGPGGVDEPRAVEDKRRLYSERVAETDRNLAALLAAWDRAIGLDRSLVAFYSDHGEHLGEPGRPTERHGDSMDDVLLRVPLVVHYPVSSGVTPGVDPRPASLIDLAPTILGLAGVDEAADERGLSGRSLLSDDVSSMRPLFADHQLHGEELSSVRSGAEKLVINWARGERALVRPREFPARVPEADWRVDDPARAAELGALFDAYAEQAAAATRGLASDVEIDADELERRLRAIGYVSD